MSLIINQVTWDLGRHWLKNSAAFNFCSGDKLLKGLTQRYQKSYRNPAKMVDRVMYDDWLSLDAQKIHAHSIWAFCLLESLISELNFDQKSMELKEPAFSVTLIDHHLVRGVPITVSQKDPIRKREARASGPSIIDLVAQQAQWISPRLNSVGIMEPEIFVSTSSVSRYARFYEYHSHHIVWGCSDEQLRRSLEPFQRQALPGLTRRPSVLIRPIEANGLPKLVSYLTKLPCKQRQVYFDIKEDKKKTFVGPLQPVNYVRWCREMKGVTMPDLTIATGAGDQVVEQALDIDLRCRALEACF